MRATLVSLRRRPVYWGWVIWLGSFGLYGNMKQINIHQWRDLCAFHSMHVHVPTWVEPVTYYCYSLKYTCRLGSRRYRCQMIAPPCTAPTVWRPKERTQETVDHAWSHVDIGLEYQIHTADEPNVRRAASPTNVVCWHVCASLSEPHTVVRTCSINALLSVWLSIRYMSCGSGFQLPATHIKRYILLIPRTCHNGWK